MAQANDIDRLNYLIGKIEDNTTGIFKSPNEHLMTILNNCRAFLLKQKAPNIELKPFCDLNEEFDIMSKETKYKQQIKDDISEIIKILRYNDWDNPKEDYYEKGDMKIFNKKFFQSKKASKEDERKLKQLIDGCRVKNNNLNNNLKIGNKTSIQTQSIDKLILDPSLPVNLLLSLFLFKPFRKCLNSCKKKKQKSLKHINNINNVLDKID